MSFDWHDYFLFAQKLTANPNLPGPEEAALRSAISRAYYSAYIQSRRWAEARGLIISGSTHKAVIDYFKQSRDKSQKNIGYELDRLRLYRTEADYDNALKSGSPSSVASMAITLANRVISNLLSL